MASPSAPQMQVPSLPAPAPITPNGQVVEDVIARVNDQIITRGGVRAQRRATGRRKRSRTTRPAAELEDRLHNMLRDMIDQQLLLSKGKELGITGDAETMRQLDEIRKQNHLDSMEALEKAAAQQGVQFEDFKQSIRNNVHHAAGGSRRGWPAAAAYPRAGSRRITTPIARTSSSRNQCT